MAPRTGQRTARFAGARYFTSKPQWQSSWTFFHSKLSLVGRKAFHKQDLDEKLKKREPR